MGIPSVTSKSIDVREAIATISPLALEIWLLGSRANYCARLDSDWDFLVVCTESNFDAVIRNAKSQTSADVCDWLVTTDKKFYWKRPWVIDEARNFADWEWIEDKANATYVSIEFASDSAEELAEIPKQYRGNTGNTVSVRSQAVRIYPIRNLSDL